MKLFSAAIFLMCMPLLAIAQVPIDTPDLYKKTYICPNYFGPYAFPVPDLLEAQVRDKLYVELSADAVVGRIAGAQNRDYTYVPTFRVSVPLWSDRLNLSVWGEFTEHYMDSPQSQVLRRVDPSYPLEGEAPGNIYYSIDMLLLRETRSRPSVVLRLATQSANGGDYGEARHYDAPGYFFDCSLGKSLYLQGGSYFRASATLGFLCWQTDRGRQNDAYILGGKISYNQSIFTIVAEYGQYTGWEKCNDAPKTIKSRLDFHIKRFHPFLYYAHGLSDWPFDQFRCGLAVDFNISIHNRL